jgi:tetratricopeptide (TPR) repeat protein
MQQKKQEERISELRDVPTGNALFNKLINAGNLEMAIRVIRATVAIQPNHDAAIFNLAIGYRLAGRFKDASNLNTLLLNLNPNDGDAQLELKACQQRHFTGSRDYEAARTLFLAAWKAKVGENADEQAERAVQSMNVDDPDVASLFGELVEIGKTGGFLNHKEPRPPSYNDRGRHKRAYQIGEILNRIGGFTLMQKVGEAVNLLALHSLRIPRGIEHCWDGIGSWRS